MTRNAPQKQCRECLSMSNLEAPYCDACGLRFGPYRQQPQRWKYCLGAAATGLAGAIIHYWWTQSS